MIFAMFPVGKVFFIIHKLPTYSFLESYIIVDRILSASYWVGSGERRKIKSLL